MAAFAASSLALVSCAKPDPETIILQAQELVSQGNYDAAREFCRSLTDTAQMQLSPSQLCRTAILYVRISELDDSPREMVNATECLERATTLNPDSVTAFVEAADVDDKATISLIRNVNRAITDPAALLDTDSI